MRALGLSIAVGLMRISSTLKVRQQANEGYKRGSLQLKIAGETCDNQPLKSDVRFY
jgi:hypothetical protein